MNEVAELQRTVVNAKYRVEGLNWVPSEQDRAYRVGLWKFITKV